MRVLHVNDCAFVAANLVEGLKALGVEAEVFQPTKGTYRGLRRTNRIERAVLPLTRTVEAFHLRRYVQRRRFDIVHVHYARFAYMTLLTGLPYVLHLHGGDLYCDLHRPGLRQLTLLAIRKARQVFYSTPDLGNIAKSIREDAIFLPNPVRLESFTPASLPENHQVLSLSRLNARKGIDQILRIVELVWTVRPEVKVAMFNFGDACAQAQHFIEKHRRSTHLTLLSPVPHQDMPALINASSIILGQQSSRIGALGVSEIEAMACAKPVVCYYAYPEAYPEPPPILVSHTPEEGRDHILRLLDDAELRRKIGEQARQWVQAYHGVDQVSRRLLEYYRENLDVEERQRC